jgi:membrane-associated phospholipid phosphatase
MCLSAVYLQHHYIVDVILGVIYASVTLAALSFCMREKAGDLPVAPALPVEIKLDQAPLKS